MATDKLIIDTPEQVHLEFALAGIGSRFMAVFADIVIQILVFLVLLILDETFLKGEFVKSMSHFQVWVLAVLIFAFFCLYWVYYAAFEALWNGQTPGKRWAGIRVIKDSGRPINAFEAIGRNVLRVIDQFPGMYAVGLVTMLLNTQNRRLGDFVAGTLVVHDKRVRESDLFFNSAAMKSEFALHQAARLGVQEVELIETFLARRLDIPKEVRQQNAQRIAELIAAKLGVDAAARPADNEDFLELTVREFRNRSQYR